MSSLLAIVQIDELIRLQNDKSKQLKSSDYCETGMLPIVDQGAALVCGYTNDLTKKYDKGLPVIIFGDHTLHTKFIDFDFAIGADGTQIIVPKNKNCDTKYLYFLVLRAAELIGSEGYKRHLSILRECDIEFISDIGEQQKIAAILTAVDDVIESTQAQINKLKDLKTGMMQELLTKGIGHTEFKGSPVGRIPFAWRVIELEKLCTWMGVGIATSTTHAYTDNGIPILRNQNILAGTIDKSDILRITKEFSEENKTKKIKARDVITIRTGYPGKSAVVTEEFHDCHTFTTLISRPDQSLIDSDFLALIINSDYGMNFVAGGQAGGAQQNLNVSILKIFPVKLPDLIEQRKIYSLVSSVTEKIELVEKRQAQLVMTKKALMQDLLTGKVRVSVN